MLPMLDGKVSDQPPELQHPASHQAITRGVCAKLQFDDQRTSGD